MLIQTSNVNDNQLMGMNGDVLLPETFTPKYLDLQNEGTGGIQDWDHIIIIDDIRISQQISGDVRSYLPCRHVTKVIIINTNP